MFTNNELKIKVPNGWSFTVEENTDGSHVFTFAPVTAEDTTNHHKNDNFKLVPASQLSLKDNFMSHIPQTDREKELMAKIEKVIRDGMHDFWCPVCDPYFDNNGHICYEPGNELAVNRSYNWWLENAKKFGYRLGTYSEFIAFLAVFIKEAPNYRKTYAWAWNAVCEDSREVWHYWISSDAKHAFEATGNGEFCDLDKCSYTCKILAHDEKTDFFWLAGGNYPLADLCRYRDRNYKYGNSCGWLVRS